MQPVVFLDRDGTLIEEVNYLLYEEQVKIFSNTIQALRLLREAGFLLIVVSNQSGVARGFLSEDRVEQLNQMVFSQMRLMGEVPDDFYFCPHYPDAKIEIYRKECDCRKPKPGMIEKARLKFDLNLDQCYSIGDKLADGGLAQNYGGKGVLVLTGHGKDEKEKIGRDSEIIPDKISPDILEAAKWVVNDMKNVK
jgi:D-glycero-D-manno-heptose 1,7-bisphosphate phosphatase